MFIIKCNISHDVLDTSCLIKGKGGDTDSLYLINLIFLV